MSALCGCVWKCCVPLCTQWFCWSLSLLNGYFIGGIPYFQTNPCNQSGYQPILFVGELSDDHKSTNTHRSSYFLCEYVPWSYTITQLHIIYRHMIPCKCCCHNVYIIYYIYNIIYVYIYIYPLLIHTDTYYTFSADPSKESPKIAPPFSSSSSEASSTAQRWGVSTGL